MMPTRTVVTAFILAGLAAGCAETKREVPLAPTRDRATVGYKIGVPYQIKGVWYYPEENFSYSETGLASWYGRKFHGRTTANGETYDMNDMTAAHKTLPMPSVVQVTNLENGRSVKLRVNDRGPFVDGRVIDVSRRASQMLGFYKQGTARVKVDIVSEESMALAGVSPQRPAAKQVGYAPEPVPTEAKPVTYAAAALPAPKPQNEMGQAEQQRLLAKAAVPPPSARRPTPMPAPAVVVKPTPAVLADAAAALPRAPAAAGSETASLEEPLPYVQAGAFSYEANAELVRARLRELGPVMISTVERNGHALFRVRVGPAASDDDAGRLLAAVMDAGFPTSRIVYE